MQSKYDAIEHFSFMKRIYDKAPNSGFVINEGGEEVDLCGVFFYQNHAYSMNRHIIGRVRIDDNMPIEKPIFWKFEDEEYNDIASKFLLNMKGYCKPDEVSNNVFNSIWAHNIGTFFNKSADTCVFFKAGYLLKFIEDVYGDKEVSKIKTYVNISVTSDYRILMDFQPIKPTPKNQPVQTIIPIFTNPSQVQNIRLADGVCTLNVFYLHNILKYSFPEDSIIGLKYRLDCNVPGVLFSKKHDIFWAISQKKLQ